jgi:hypothetical protein
MRRDYLMYGLAVFVIGALLVWAIPDPGDSENRALARADGSDAGNIDTDAGAMTANGIENGADVLGWLAMLAGLGIALTGLFRNSVAERAAESITRRI